MSTSPRVGRVRFKASTLDELEPLSAHRVRNLVANNALHYADTKANHWINWVSPKASHLSGGNPLVRTPNPILTRWTRIDTYGPFRVTRRADGTPYPIRMELLGASASAATSVQFAITLSASPSLGADLVEDAAVRIAGFGCVYAATALATPAWLAAAHGLKFFTPSLHALRRSTYSTLVDTGGDPTDVEVTETYVVVWGKSASAIVAPRVYGMHVSEYVGT